MDVSIITINYNTSALFKDFLKTLNNFFPKKYSLEVIIIDNASTTESFNELKHILTDKELSDLNILLHRSNINLGFGGGNMLGNQFATGKYLAFINNDVIFTEDCFSPLIDFLKNNKNAGVCSPQQYNIRHEPTSGLDYFHGIRKELFGRSFVEVFMKKDQVKRKEFPYNKNSKADFIQGCFLFFKSTAFSKIGGFDTNIFLYFEEMDICYRLLKHGYKSYIIPSSSFLHLHGASTPKNLTIKQEFLLSKLYIYKKNYCFFKYKILQVVVSLKYFFKSLIKFENFKLFYVAITGANLKHSLKHKQTINYI